MHGVIPERSSSQVTAGSLMVAVTVNERWLFVVLAGRVTVSACVPVPEVADRVGFVPVGPVTAAVHAFPSSAWIVTVAVVALPMIVEFSVVTENSSGLWTTVTV